MEPSKKDSYVCSGNFLSSKNVKNRLSKNFLYFGKWNLLPLRLKSYYIFLKEVFLVF